MSDQTVWTLTECDGRHGTFLLGIYASKEDARLALRAVQERETNAASSPIRWASRSGLTEGGWSVSDQRGTAWFVDPKLVQTMPSTRTERRLTCTECGAVSVWLVDERDEQKWRDYHLQGGPDHGETAIETREVKL